MNTSNARPRHQAFGALILLMLMLLGLAWGGWAASQAAESSPTVRWIAHHMVLSPATEQPIPAQPVVLPDSWKSRGLPGTGMARYRSTFELTVEGMADSQRQPWSLHLDRLSTEHRLWLNGRLLHSTLPRGLRQGEPRAHLIDIPEGLLQPGLNTLDIEVHCAVQGGLSAPALAPKAMLRGGFLIHELCATTLPMLLNAACAALAIFLILLWWRRREETAVGLFGLLYLLTSARNYSYYVNADLGWPVGLTHWLYFCAHVETATLLGWFALHFSQQPWPAFNRWLWIVQVSFPLMAAATVWWVDPRLTTLRLWLNPMLMLMALPSLWLLMRLSRQLKRATLLCLTLGAAAVLAAGTHDFVFVRLMGQVMSSYWMPWAFPLSLATFYLLLVHRFDSAITDIEQANATLEHKVAQRTQELATANAAKSHFLASASHDLRQPVAAIGLITDLLRERLTDPALRGLTDRLTRAVIAMEHLLKGLLDLSRLDSGTVEVKFQRIPLQALLESITSHEAETARHKGLHLRIRPTSAVAMSDPTLLQQILRNLVGNAVHHTQHGGVLVTVRRHKARLLIQVWDTGGGIAPHNVDRIFDEFVQLGNPAREGSQGLGLGLSIVKRAARLLDHSIRVRSTLGHGSCFSVEVPAAPLHAAPPPLVTPVQPGVTDGFSLQGQHVLVVEDDPNIRGAISLILRNWGAQVSTGGCIAELRQGSFETTTLVISDHRLPDGTGIDAVKLLRQQHPQLPAIIITGDTAPEHIQHLHDSALPVLHKPFRTEGLRAMIEATLAGRNDARVKD